MNEYLSFTEKYILHRKLDRIKDDIIKDLDISDIISLYLTYTDQPYCNLEMNTVTLPAKRTFDLIDYRTQLEHELKHFKVTKNSPYFSEDYIKKSKVANILDDIIINKTINLKRLKRLYEKLGEEVPLGLYLHYDEEGRERLLKKAIEKGILKNEKSFERIKKIFDETIKKRNETVEKGKSFISFYKSYKYLFHDFVSLFTDDTYKLKGDGHGEFDSSYNYPDWDLYNEFKRLIKNLKSPTEITFYENKFYGKKINRKWIEFEQEIKPFKYSKTEYNVNTPSILCILDLSGSMKGTDESNMKAFVCALIATRIKVDIIGCSDHGFVKPTTFNEVVKLAPYGDEGFDKLPEELIRLGFKKNYDIVICITDLVVSENEAKGLEEFFKEIESSRKYLLVTNLGNRNDWESTITTPKRVSIHDKDAFINFVKKLISGI